MKPIKSLAMEWASLEQAVMHPDAPKMQRREARRMFYAGVRIMMNIMMYDLDPSEDVTDSDMELIDKIHQELDQFGKDLEEGRA